MAGTMEGLKVADEVWIATALLHREQPGRADFSVQEIRQRVKSEDLAVRQAAPRRLGMSRAFWDTHLFIYLLED